MSDGSCPAAMARTAVAYYITGHGLGHATRSMELIRALLLAGSFVVHVVSHVNANFFYNSLKDFGIDVVDKSTGDTLFMHHDRNLDTGAVQADVFVVDAKETLVKYMNQIHKNRSASLQQEIAWLQAHAVRLVLSDAIPLGCVAGHLAGARTVLLSNFSWDFCFKEMLQFVSQRGALPIEDQPRYEDMVRQAEQDSSACDLYLQLPGATPLSTGFPNEKVLAGPLIARPTRTANMRAQLGIGAEQKVLLLGFGGHSAEWHLEDAFLPDGWICLV